MASNSLNDPSQADRVSALERHIAALEASGRTSEAVTELARAANHGDAGAKLLIGERLLIGLRVPLRPKEGISLIAEASDQGIGRASALLAMLAAAGAYIPQSWQRALALLGRAAELGFEPARGQLAILAGAASPDDHVGSDRPPLQHRAEQGVRHLLRPGSIVITELSAAPRIVAAPSFMPAAICHWLIERARPRLTRAQVYDAAQGRTLTFETRTNSIAIFGLTDSDVITVLVQAAMAQFAGVPFSQQEALAVLHYAQGEQITEHYDFVSPKTPNYDEEIRQNGQRVLTFLINLNDDYEGGETEFPKLGISHKGKRGDALYFSNADAAGKPDLRTIHAGRPPAQGEKWIVSQFFRNRAVVPGSAMPH